MREGVFLAETVLHIAPPGQVLRVVLLAGLLAGCQHQRGAAPAVPAPTKLASGVLPRHLPMPVQGVRPEALKNTWGDARSNGRQHAGIDIKAPLGTLVLSTTAGVVVRRSEHGGGGKAIWVHGPGGSRHYYAHLRRFLVQVGDRVQAGSAIGEVGQTGNATMPHLHYGVQPDGEHWANPYPYLR